MNYNVEPLVQEHQHEEEEKEEEKSNDEVQPVVMDTIAEESYDPLGYRTTSTRASNASLTRFNRLLAANRRRDVVTRRSRREESTYVD
jgi:hypothetical protein